jgi:hemoglobin
MVVRFYTKVLEDKVVGSFFIAKLGNDLESDYWKPHIETLVNFWSSIILQDGSYGGNPLAPHFSIGELNKGVFEQWLKLFFETVDEVFIPKLGLEFKNRSEIIAGNFMRNLGVS